MHIDQMIENGNEHLAVRQISGRGIEIEQALFAVEIPFPWRCQRIEHVLDEKAVLLEELPSHWLDRDTS